MIKAATAKEGFFAITVNDVDAIGVIVVLSWSAAQRNGSSLLEEAEKYHGR